MKTNRLLLAASVVLAMVFNFSCSGGDDNGPGSSSSSGGGNDIKSGLYTGCKVQGICTAVPSTEPELCQTMNGVIDNSCTFVNCKIQGICTAAPSAGDCQMVSGEVVSDEECGGGSLPSSSGGNSSSSISGNIGNSSSSSNNVQTDPDLIWDLSMGTEVSTGGGWYDYGDFNSFAYFYDLADDDYWPVEYVEEWDGAILFDVEASEYAGAGFSWLKNSGPAPDVWGSHTGLCLEYSLSGTGTYYLRINAEYPDYNEFRIELTKQSSFTKKLFYITDFRQASGGTKTLSDAKSRSTGMQIHIESTSPTASYTGTLKFRSIRWDACK